jgi:hypothetical protein
MPLPALKQVSQLTLNCGIQGFATTQLQKMKLSNRLLRCHGLSARLFARPLLLAERMAGGVF